jgi:hypothetical protein
MANSKPCTICGGQPEEHAQTKHIYTQNHGEMMTAEQKAQQHKGPNPFPPTVLRLPGAQTNEAGAISRLVELMLDKKMIDQTEALFILGVGSKPTSRFTDPARMM